LRIVLAVAVLLIAGAVAAVVPESGAGAAARLTGFLPFGCANSANRLADVLLPAAPGSVRDGMTCFGTVRLGVGFLGPAATRGPVGYGPDDLQAAYGVAGMRAHGRTVAIVDAYDDPKAEADLAAYRDAYGLPPCTSDNGCFRKLNQNGKLRPLPSPDLGWAEEISLDLDAVSAVCPTCHILLVEANRPTVRPLMTAVDTAVRLGAVVVSNSYGGREDRSELREDAHLHRPGVTMTFASGDVGYGVQWPASSRFVTAVGGTTLEPATNRRGWTEQAWPGAGSGCSRFERKPAWQHDRRCAHRMVADVSAAADPDSGIGAYDTFNSCAVALLCNALIATGTAKGLNGWAQIGGTSLSTPIIAAIYALAGNHRKARWLYEHRGALHDVRAGSNGKCRVRYFCHARVGYDGPTGLGTPRGTTAF
jgi:subtilase family serine protease